MFIINTQITIEWVMPITANPPTGSTISVRIIKPDMSVITGNLYSYIQPTINTEGKAEYKFMPDMEGVWKIDLLIAQSPNNFKDINNTEIYVTKAETFLYPIGYGDGNLTIPGN